MEERGTRGHGAAKLSTRAAGRRPKRSSAEPQSPTDGLRYLAEYHLSQNGYGCACVCVCVCV
eukprot:13289495-Alexandrium_andersonii.AAC.1